MSTLPATFHRSPRSGSECHQGTPLVFVPLNQATVAPAGDEEAIFNRATAWFASRAPMARVCSPAVDRPSGTEDPRLSCSSFW